LHALKLSDVGGGITSPTLASFQILRDIRIPWSACHEEKLEPGIEGDSDARC